MAMSVVGDVLNVVLFDLFEDPPIGPILGLITEQQLIDLFNLTLTDFVQRTCLISLIQTQTIFAGVGQYTVPDAMMRVDLAFLAGQLLEPTTAQALQNGQRDWRTALGLSTRWHADELPLKTVELVSIPNYDGLYIDGPNEPDPPHAQLGSFNVTQADITYTQAQHQDLTLIGPQLPATVAAPTDPICFGTVGSPTAYLPQDLVLGFLAFGVLARIWSSDSELKDNTMAAWAQGEYEEGVAIMQAVMGEIA